MTTRFSPDGDEVVIDGGKIFITSGDVADLILLFGKWSEIEDDRGAITALVLEKGAPGFAVERTEDKMGIRASSTAVLSFDNCRVPRANLVGGSGEGAFHPSPVAQQVAGPASRATRSASRTRRSRTRSPS